MEKILARLKGIFASLKDIRGLSAKDLSLKKISNMPLFREFITKKRIINCLQKKILFIFVILLFSVLTRPVALDIAEIQGINEEIAIENDLEEVTEENIFPFKVTKPQDGLNRRLTRAEMRWIFKEELRLNAMKRVINDGNERAHRAYSAMAQDFNARGANFKYELRDKIKAEEDIEIYREEIVKNAMEEARAYGWGQL